MPLESDTEVPSGRKLPRFPRSGQIWWKISNERDFQRGWLIERSIAGAAFLVRGTKPLPDTTIRTFSADPLDEDCRMAEGIVRRVEHLHADLALVGIQLKCETG